MEELDADLETANNLISFTQWMSELENSLTALFAAFAVLNIFDPTKATVSIGAGPLCKQLGRHSVLCEDKVKTKINEVLGLAYQAGNREQVDLLYNTMLNRILSREYPHRSVSGKDFILPLLLFKLQSINCKITYKTLRRRLASSCDLSAFERLKADTLHVAGGGAVR